MKETKQKQGGRAKHLKMVMMMVCDGRRGTKMMMYDGDGDKSLVSGAAKNAFLGFELRLLIF